MTFSLARKRPLQNNVTLSRCSSVHHRAMPQVSKNPIPKETEKRIRKAFVKAFVDLNSEDEMERYIFDLLTPTERIMLAKRLAIAALLIWGLPYHSIAEKLKVSTSTIGRVKLWLRTAGDGYRLVIERIGEAGSVRI